VRQDGYLQRLRRRSFNGLVYFELSNTLRSVYSVTKISVSLSLSTLHVFSHFWINMGEVVSKLYRFSLDVASSFMLALNKEVNSYLHVGPVRSQANVTTRCNYLTYL
jgi:hypothetical protein